VRSKPIGIRVHRVLLAFALPRAIYRRHREEIACAFEDLRRDAQTRGALALVVLWSREIRALLRTCVRLHRSTPPTSQRPGDPLMRSLLEDMRYAIRSLRRSPGFAVVAVTTLALGIGATTTMFSVVQGTLLSPLPYPNSERLIVVAEAQSGSPDNMFVASPANAADWMTQQQTLEGLAMFNIAMATVPEDGGLTTLHGATVSTNYFDVIGVAPALGRAFAPDEQGPGSPTVVILSHRAWQSHFAGDSALVGRTIHFGRSDATVIGIMPRGFRSPDEHYYGPSDFWSPITFDPTSVGRRGHWIRTIGRMRPGVTIATVRAELEGIQHRIHLEHPGEDFDDHIAVVRGLRDTIVGDVRPTLILLLGAVGIVLVVACTNIGNLMLARAVTRSHELAVRTALGASRSRIVREVLVESTILTVSGASLGLGLTWLALPKLVALAPDLPRPDDVSVNAPVVAFAIAAALVTGVLFGLIPAFGVLRNDPQEVLRESDRSGTEGRERGKVRQVLVIVEVALSIVLLIGAGLLVRSFIRVMSVDPGFQPEAVVTAQLGLPSGNGNGFGGEPQDPEAARITQMTELLTRLRGVPGVRAAGAVSSLPLDGLNNMSLGIRVEGVEYTDDNQYTTAPNFRTVTPGYFDAMGITLLRGRLFTEADGAGAPQVALVSDVFVDRYLDGQDPIGRRVWDFGFSDMQFDGHIIGVIHGVKYVNLQQDADPEIYIPFDQFPGLGTQFFAVKGAQDHPITASQMRSLAKAVNPNITVDKVTSMPQLVKTVTSRPRFNMMLFSGFAAFGLTLAALNLYAVIGYTVTQRRREIAIRMALGAEVGQVVSYIVRGGAALALIGTAVGLFSAFVASRLIASLLFELSPHDPLTFIGVPTVTVLVALLASYWPARRIAQVDPTTALRD
jgi:putative ABC transport system permease protein